MSDRIIETQALRKKVYDYTRKYEVFTSVDLKKNLGIVTNIITANGVIVTDQLKEFVFWGYLSSQKQGSTVRYYVNL